MIPVCDTGRAWQKGPIRGAEPWSLLQDAFVDFHAANGAILGFCPKMDPPSGSP